MSVTERSINDLASAQATYLHYLKTGEYRGSRFISLNHITNWVYFRKAQKHLLFWSFFESKVVQQHYRDWIAICDLWITSLQRDYDDAHRPEPHPAYNSQLDVIPTPASDARLIPPRPPQTGDVRA